MPVLALDIGNSRVGLAVFTNGRSEDPAKRIHHADLDKEFPATVDALWKTAHAQAQAEQDDAPGIVIASVVPSLTAKLEAQLAHLTNTKPVVIGRDLLVPFKTKLRDDSTVGQDRLLAALAAYVNTEQACVVIHVGTALVVDCIDAEGVFCGGAIAPGLQMAAKALQEHTAQLPQASLTPPDDASPFGRFTQEAINLGIYVGARGAVRELIERYATALSVWPHVVATGGDANALLADTDLVDSFIPDLVLQGAALTWENKRMTE